MSLLFMDGFEMSDGSLKWDSVSGYATANTSPRVSSNGGYYLHPSTSASLTKSVTASTLCTAGAAIRLNSLDTSDTLMLFTYAGGYSPLWLGINSTGYLEVRYYPSIFSSAQVLATGTTKLLTSTWYYLEMQAQISDSSGVAKVRINGSTTPDINFTGNTFPTGSGTHTIDTYTMTVHGDIDDVYMANAVGTSNTTFLGDVRVYALLPSGNGTYSQLTGSDGDSANNYQLVNEKPYNTANYVGSATSGQRDTYTLSDIPGNVSAVLGVQSNIIAAKSDAGTVSMKPALKAGSNLYYGASRSPNTAYGLYTDTFDKNPDTNTAWSVADVNNLEGGMEVV